MAVFKVEFVQVEEHLHHADVEAETAEEALAKVKAKGSHPHVDVLWTEYQKCVEVKDYKLVD